MLPLHLPASPHRYFRFFPGGTFAYRTSPEPLARVHRSLGAAPKAPTAPAQGRGRGGAGGSKEPEQVFHGRFKQEVGALCRAVLCVCGLLAGAPFHLPSPQSQRLPAKNACTARTVQGDRVWTALRYDLRGSTEVRSRLRLRSTCPGANNRLDIQAIVSWDREDRQGLPLLDVTPDEEAEEGVEARQHKRGMSPYVFVPFEQAATHLINLPVSQMDCFIAG